QKRKEKTGMEKTNVKAGCSLAVLGVSLWIVPPARAQVDCDKDPPGALQQAIDTAGPGATIQVSGTCNENVLITEGKERVTLDGGGKAAVNGPDATRSTIAVRGRGITVKGFMITGGLDGITFARGAQGTVDGNTVLGAARYGVNVAQMGFAVIVNNTIESNSNSGIDVAGNSFALIGFYGTGPEVVASRNVIRR